MERKIILPVALVLMVIIGSGIFYFLSKNTQTDLQKDESVGLINTPGTNLSQYENTKFGFSFFHPVWWRVDNSDPTWPGPEGVIVNDQSGNPIMTISYSNSIEETSMAAPMDNRNTLKEALEYELRDIRETSIGGSIAYEGFFINDAIKLKQKQIWFEHQGHVYSIGLTKENDPEIDTILSSFKWMK